MRWPWQRNASRDRLIVSWSSGTLAYVRAALNTEGLFAVQQVGIERQGSDSTEDFARRLQALGLKGLVTHVMLRPEQYQLLQIDAPPVAPEELRAAARFQIREMVNVHIDDITLDVMQVGDGQQKGPNNLFVVAAKNEVVREVLALGVSLNWKVPVIDVQETAQRNLQSALAKQEGRLDRADATLLISDELQAVLTISVNEELYLTRRLDLPQGFLTMQWGADSLATAEVAVDTYTPVDEYVPDYAGGGTLGASTAPDQGNERVQRFLVEVQRSLDLWDRTWSSLPLAGLRVYAGERSSELAAWLSREMGQTVGTMDMATLFPGLQSVGNADQLYCLPLLGAAAHRNPQALSIQP